MYIFHDKANSKLTRTNNITTQYCSHELENDFLFLIHIYELNYACEKRSKI